MKTKNPFENTLGAFDVFFDTQIKIMRKHSFEISLPACVIDNGFDEVFSESGKSTTRKLISVQIRRYSPLSDFCGDDFWPFNDKCPQTGDTIVLEDNSKYKILDVDIFDKSIFKINAKSIS